MADDMARKGVGTGKTARKTAKATAKTKAATKKATKAAARKAVKKKKSMDIEWYREHHRRIPGEVYEAKVKAGGRTKTVARTNRAPLGRPPTEPRARRRYDELRRAAPPTAAEVRAKKEMNARLRELRAMDDYEQEKAEAMYKGWSRSELDAELEDRGYGDTRSNWRRTGDKTKKRALYDEARKEARLREADDWDAYWRGYRPLRRHPIRPPEPFAIPYFRTNYIYYLCILTHNGNKPGSE